MARESSPIKKKIPLIKESSWPASAMDMVNSPGQMVILGKDPLPMVSCMALGPIPRRRLARAGRGPMKIIQRSKRKATSEMAMASTPTTMVLCTKGSGKTSSAMARENSL